MLSGKQDEEEDDSAGAKRADEGRRYSDEQRNIMVFTVAQTEVTVKFNFENACILQTF